MLSYQGVCNSQKRIAPYIHRTPVLSSSSINNESGREVFFKCENFQRTGAFKARGAFSALTALSEAERQKGVVTHSSGNHAAALASASQTLDIPCTVVMPEDAPDFKKRAVMRYGAKVVICAPGMPDREATTQNLIRQYDLTLVHPYDDDEVIYGQASASVEFIEEVPHMDLLLLPIGGGGLISGAVLARDELRAATDVIGVEPELVNEAEQSLFTGKRLPATGKKTIADGLQAGIGERNYALLSNHDIDILTVTEDDIRLAMRVIMERLKVVIEPSAVVAVAALLTGKVSTSYQSIGTILTGGNIDIDMMSAYL